MQHSRLLWLNHAIFGFRVENVLSNLIEYFAPTRYQLLCWNWFLAFSYSLLYKHDMELRYILHICKNAFHIKFVFDLKSTQITKHINTFYLQIPFTMLHKYNSDIINYNNVNNNEAYSLLSS